MCYKLFLYFKFCSRGENYAPYHTYEVSLYFLSPQNNCGLRDSSLKTAAAREKTMTFFRWIAELVLFYSVLSRDYEGELIVSWYYVALTCHKSTFAWSFAYLSPPGEARLRAIKEFEKVYVSRWLFLPFVCFVYASKTGKSEPSLARSK